MPGLPDDTADLASPTDLTKFKSGDPAAIVRQATQAIRSHCHWHIAPIIEQTLHLEGDGDDVLFLPTLEVVELLDVTNDGVVVDLADVDTSEAGYLELRRGTWSTRAGRVVVHLRHGYATVPHDVQGVLAAVALRAVDSPAGRVREHAGGVDIGFGQPAPGVSGGLALMEHERDLLAPYVVDK